MTRFEMDWFVLLGQGGEHVLVLVELGGELCPLGFDVQVVRLAIWRLGLRGQRGEAAVLGSA